MAIGSKLRSAVGLMSLEPRVRNRILAMMKPNHSIPVMYSAMRMIIFPIWGVALRVGPDAKLERDPVRSR